MTPPEAPTNGSQAERADRPPAVSVCPDDGARPGLVALETLRKRADFLACARSRKQPMPGFLLQARRREEDGDLIRVGYTASKKVGNSVIRNRAKRRLRALARAVIAAQGRPGWDYVLVARGGETIARPFVRLEAELAQAIETIHAPRKPR